MKRFYESRNEQFFELSISNDTKTLVNHLVKLELEIDLLFNILESNLTDQNSFKSLKNDLNDNKNLLILLISWMRLDLTKNDIRPEFDQFDCDSNVYTEIDCRRKNYLNYLKIFQITKERIMNIIHGKPIGITDKKCKR